MGSSAHRRSGLVHARLIASAAGGGPARSTTQMRRSTALSVGGAPSYIPGAMKFDDLAYWTEFARKAEAELKAATGRTALNAAAKKVMMAKRELKKLKQKAPTPRASGAKASADAS